MPQNKRLRCKLHLYVVSLAEAFNSGITASPVKKQLPYFILVFLLPVLLMLWWWGMFSTASVHETVRTSYRYAYLEAQGPYSKLANKQDEVLFELKQQGVAADGQLTLLMSDPRTTPHEELRARTGYLIPADVEVKAPLNVEEIAASKVVVASIKAHPLFAYGKTYGALLDYCQQHQMSLKLPTIEIMDNSVLRVEMTLENTP